MVAASVDRIKEATIERWSNGRRLTARTNRLRKAEQRVRGALISDFMLEAEEPCYGCRARAWGFGSPAF